MPRPDPPYNGGMVRAPRLAAAALSVFVALPLAGCRRAEPTQNEAFGQTAATTAQLQASQTVEIVFLGDSLTSGLGLTADQAFPKRVEEMFHAEGYDEVEILNAGVTGDTTAGALRRVEQVLSPASRILVVALGGNDALRALTTAQTQENLAAIIDGGLARGMAVMLAGMEAPPNLGEDYQRNFRASFAELARTYRGRISYVPFLLEGVAGTPALNQPDGIHPNEAGAKKVAEHLYPPLRDMVDQLPRSGVGQ